MNILFVMAVEAEYGPHLRERITPLITGVGPVEAAIAVTAELSRLAAANNLPDLVVCLGSAGSQTLAQAEVYQISSVAYRDMDASALGFEPGRTPFLDLPRVLDLPLRIEGVPTASLSTGAAVISGAAYDAIDADLVEMETFAVWRACQRFGVPLIGLRGISDGAEDLQTVADWTEYLGVIDAKLALAVDSIKAGHYSRV
ncbi:5'-methylthioadenosine/S-adenosylhomocysteine nucleosidase [Ornithinimicrobium sp. INDO-MA30-4]|uniref:5'-methylthioadenosine/S-adenosylhomocysteine nucleosidase n=1 Tax=Ornithinimicrobium sp. INDO-MA30-4 TaxID=2908651 RepID=UPI001F40520E|nr:5'-methylthioadenosine/S-adenosylhomocysteine nucleosidase [Ornithinimicrobium sp. INDO-MA30-4]UJH70334.1 5'-methylthioadenosine/S-adenosylhomocysteine nucleosidase [Ornithinimicrobium sp. INDO-MA30-4]